MTTSHAVVIGSGIGGLTAAVALYQRGWQVTVLERAASLEPVGAGIALAPNAQRALDVIGLGDEIRSLAAWQGDGGMRTPDGRWVSRASAEAARERFGGPIVLLHRATLVDRIASRLPEGVIRTGAPAAVADPGVAGGRRAVVSTPDGDLEADLVVGADGIHSAVRGVLFPSHPGPSYTGLTAWRVLIAAEDAPDQPFEPHETWGRGALWGTQPLKDGRIYAYAAATAPVGDHAPDGEQAELLRRFGDWHDPIPAIIAAAATAAGCRELDAGGRRLGPGGEQDRVDAARLQSAAEVLRAGGPVSGAAGGGPAGRCGVRGRAGEGPGCRLREVLPDQPVGEESPQADPRGAEVPARHPGRPAGPATTGSAHRCAARTPPWSGSASTGSSKKP